MKFILRNVHLDIILIGYTTASAIFRMTDIQIDHQILQDLSVFRKLLKILKVDVDLDKGDRKIDKISLMMIERHQNPTNIEHVLRKA